MPRLSVSRRAAIGFLALAPVFGVPARAADAGDASAFVGAIAQKVQAVGLGAVERQDQDQAVVEFLCRLVEGKRRFLWAPVGAVKASAPKERRGAPHPLFVVALRFAVGVLRRQQFGL